MFQYCFYFTHYPKKELLDDILNQNNFHSVNFYIDVKGTLPKLFDENFFKFLVNLSSDDLHKIIIRSVNQFVKYFSYLLNTAYSYNKIPRLFLFYETGESRYHKSICKTYKSSRFETSLLTEKELEKAKEIKHLILSLINGICNLIPNCFCIHWEYFEADTLPHFLLTKFAKLRESINLIYSNDKDLFQTLKFPNTYQFVFRNHKQIRVDDKNCWQVFCKKDDAKYYNQIKPDFIPLALSIAGDSADCIEGIKGVGYIKLYNFLVKHKDNLNQCKSNQEALDFLLSVKSNDKILQLIKENKTLIETNLKLCDFDIIIENIPPHILSKTMDLLRKNKSDIPTLEELQHYLTDVLGESIDLRPLHNHFKVFEGIGK